MRRALRRLLVAVTAALTTTCVLLPASPAQAAAPATGAVFNDPTAAGSRSAIQDRVVSLIDGAPAGSLVRMAMFYADDPTIPNALVAARSRGVNVQVVFDSKETALAPYQTLVSALGTTLTASSWVLACPAGRGCVGTRALGTVDAINHNKFFLFSSTGGAADVVVQSSANLHTGRDGLGGWNNALVLVGNTAVYDAYSGYFGDLEARVANNDYYNTGRTPVASGNAKIHFYPRHESSSATSPYNDPTADTVETVLDHVACKGNSVVGTQDGTHRTIIRVAMDIFSRSYLAQKLVDLDAQGCYVEVAETYDSADSSQQTVMNTLLKATSSAYNGVAVWYYCANNAAGGSQNDHTDIWIHSKYLQVEGDYYGVPDRSVTWTGSANFSTNSLRQSDETILQYEDTSPAAAGSVFAAYRSNFTAIRTSPTIYPVANGGKASCS
ncbi:phospholipase D-like domain-containing protein [Streptomyces sp. NPDC020917]|uniref:phospholipase D-like domain-containing protein n=1 Tax=Streptomyces sp. NPDC020917 TaxID=3365102 RepID=UPI0037BCC28D